jgi:hypothetical protein
MTHDELLKKIQVFLVATELQSVEDFEGTKMLKALRAVVKLHKPFNVGTDKVQCPRCMEVDFSDKRNPILVMAPYPCQTIQAIEKDLG